MSSISTLIHSIKSGQLRENIEERFGRWGHFAYRHAWLVILFNSLLLGLLIAQTEKLQIDTTMESFFQEDDPARIRYNEFRQQFGRDDKVIIAIETDEVFDLEFLARLRDLHREIEARVPFLHQVDSLINARQTLGEDDELLVQDFLEEWPQNDSDLARLKQQALNNPVYINSFVSADSTLAVIMVENESFKYLQDELDILDNFDDSLESSPHDSESDIVYLTDVDNTAILDSFSEILAEFDAPDFKIHASSGPYMTAWFLNTVKNNMATYTSLSVLAIAFFLFIIFRRLVMVFLPLSVSILAMLAAMGVMAALGIRLSFSMQIVPSFLIAVGVGNSVHIFTVFFQAINRGENKQDALAYALQHSGLAILMTGLTTAGSLLSFLSSNMKPIIEFGMMTPLGVLFALYFSLVLLPALIAVFPMSLKIRQVGKQRVRNLLVSCGNFSYRNAKLVLAIWIITAGTALFFASKLQFSFLIYNNLPQGHFLLEATRKVDENLAGTGPLELIFDTGVDGGVKNPDFLNRMDEISKLTEQYPFKKSVSVIDINKELHQALHENDPDYYRIPQDPQVISQELLLFENSGVDDLELFVDSQFRQARMTMISPMQDAVIFNPIIEDFMQDVRGILGDQYNVETTGIMDLSFNIFTEMHVSMATTYIIAFIIITPLMIFLIGSVRIGFASMLPNLIPIIVTLGVMGAFDIYLTAATLLTGSIAIGLVVDDTIHFMHNFQRYFAQTNDIRLAIEKTLETTGQAIFFTTIVLTTAFFIFMLNEVTEWAHFGFITGLCITTALLADIFLAPALVTLLNKNRVAAPAG